MDLKSVFSLKKPCGNCPFRCDDKAIPLEPGRLKGIVDGLHKDDSTVFHCHKSVHSKDGGEWNVETGEYEPSGKEKVCRGALIYMNEQGRLPVLARIAIAMGELNFNELKSQAPLVISKR